MSEDNPFAGPSESQIRATLGSVGKAFFEAFPTLREVQRRAIPPIAEGRNVLVCSATASGKTEAVVAPLIWRVRKGASAVVGSPRRIRFLAIAPTRALVSDLLKRLDRSLPSFGWSAGAQTSDHQDASKEPDALITTPESLDSMLVNRFVKEHGETSGHLLAGVEAVFVDEAHLFDCSVRGDQVLFLLERLRRLKATALERGWVQSAEIQICGASATVSNAEELALRLLGQGASALRIAGARELTVLNAENEWITVDGRISANFLARQISFGTGGGEIARKLVTIFRSGGGRKVLIFCPSRAKCDELGERLTRELQKEVDAWVGTHHGSLDGARRRAAEKHFGEAAGIAVLVATSTLEVGIDIGDVDIVGLIGPPPDVPALLQRIGRGGRRLGGTRVVPFAENLEHAAAIGGMLVAAAAGNIGVGSRFRNWGVFAQQIASYIKQNGTKGRPRKSLVELAEAVWPLSDTGSTASEVIDDLVVQRSLTEARSRFHLDGEIVEAGDKNPTSLHSNIRGGGALLAVRDSHSGEIIGHVSSAPGNGLTNVGGKCHRIVGHGEGEIIVSLESSSFRSKDTPLPVRYPTVPFLITRTYCRSVADGLGLHCDEAPVLDGVWWHFGGQAFEKLMRIVLPGMFPEIYCRGMALRTSGDIGMVKTHFRNPETVSEGLQLVVASARLRYSRSSFDDFLSDSTFERIAVEALQPQDVFEFLQSRKIFPSSLDDPVGAALSRL